MSEKNREDIRPKTEDSSFGVRHRREKRCLTPVGWLSTFCFAFLVSCLVFAATANWPFSAITEVELYDGARIEVAGRHAQSAGEPRPLNPGGLYV